MSVKTPIISVGVLTETDPVLLKVHGVPCQIQRFVFYLCCSTPIPDVGGRVTKVEGLGKTGPHLPVKRDDRGTKVGDQRRGREGTVKENKEERKGEWNREGTGGGSRPRRPCLVTDSPSVTSVPSPVDTRDSPHDRPEAPRPSRVCLGFSRTTCGLFVHFRSLHNPHSWVVSHV